MHVPWRPDWPRSILVGRRVLEAGIYSWMAGWGGLALVKLLGKPLGLTRAERVVWTEWADLGVRVGCTVACTLFAAGYALVVWGWARRPLMAPVWAIPLELRPDGKAFGRCTRWGAAFTALLMFRLILSLGFDDRGDDRLHRLPLVYFLAALALFLWYMADAYRERHTAVTTYLNVFGIPMAFVLFPVLWPLLVRFALYAVPPPPPFETAPADPRPLP